MLKRHRQFSLAAFLGVSLLVVLSGGCGGGPATGNSRNTDSNGVVIDSEKENPASDSVDKLIEHVRLPEVPEEVVWRETVIDAAGQKKKIVAVMRFEPQIRDAMMALLGPRKTAEQVDVETERWFPEELIAQAQLSGEEMLKGTSYSASDFFNVPYGFGRITKIEGSEYFVLELTTN